MNELSIEEIKRSALETLIQFRDFCDNNHLKYYLAFGTLLGAIRHKGFIPWDDDIDVLMPRKDYEYLINNFNKSAKDSRRLICKEFNHKYYLQFAKIIDTRTIMIEENENYKIGIWIDIFPMDTLPNNKKIKRKINHLNFLYKYSSMKIRKGRAFYKNWYITLLKLFYPSNMTLYKKKMNLIESCMNQKDDGNYYLAYQYFKEYGLPYLSKDLFQEGTIVEFEKEKFNAPKEYDTFLRLCYGDYMVLPSENDRVSNHKYICYWKEK